MNTEHAINILIAEDNEISRELMSTLLKMRGYNIIPVSDGTEAIRAVNEYTVDLALVDINMEPTGGFEFVKYLKTHGITLPVVVITADDSSDILTRASELGVVRILQKPVEPERLNTTVENVLKRYGHHVKNIATETYHTHFSHEQLMQRAIDLAERNAQSMKGGPFGAVVANEKGEILGEGTNGITSRSDPTAHAEIMAIRQASERLGKSDLSDCVLYCSSEPTQIGKALILSVGIRNVLFGLSHSDIKDDCLRERKKTQEPSYQQVGKEQALKMFRRWQNLDQKIED